MVSKETQFVPEYPLRYEWNAFEALAEALNAHSFADFDNVLNSARVGFKEIRIVIWAGLLHKYPDMKKEDVAELINIYMENHVMSELSGLVGNALSDSEMFKKKGVDTGEVPQTPGAISRKHSKS